MTYDEVLSCKNNTPCSLPDGLFGLLIRYGEEESGIQVPGEEDIRWISNNKLVKHGDAITVEP